MDKKLKWGCAIAVVSGLVCTGFAFWGVAAGKRSVEALQAQATEVAKRGSEACVGESARQITDCGTVEFDCHSKAGGFGGMCLVLAKDAREYCAEVPSQSSPAADQWARDACARHGQSGNAVCIEYLRRQVPSHCDSYGR